MRIQVVLHPNRLQLGDLTVVDDDAAMLLGPVPCLGKADNKDAGLHKNPKRDPKLPFGDTPTGEYAVAELVSHTKGETNLHTYGAHPSILLDPQSGDALAAKENHREGLMIHGGAPSSTGGLRPTHGCIRVSEDTQGALIDLITPVELDSVVVSVSEA